jgi:hypothetical protein
MIGIHDNLGVHQVRSKLLDCKDHDKKFLLHCGIVQLGPSQVFTRI